MPLFLKTHSFANITIVALFNFLLVFCAPPNSSLTLKFFNNNTSYRTYISVGCVCVFPQPNNYLLSIHYVSDPVGLVIMDPAIYTDLILEWGDK